MCSLKTRKVITIDLAIGERGLHRFSHLHPHSSMQNTGGQCLTTFQADTFTA